MHIRYAARTDPGLKYNHNEDSFCIIEDEQLFLVADGMGAHASGEVASKMAVDVIRKFFARSKDDNATWPYKMDGALSYPENRLVVAIKQANKKIHEAATGDVRIPSTPDSNPTALMHDALLDAVCKLEAYRPKCTTCGNAQRLGISRPWPAGFQ